MSILFTILAVIVAGTSAVVGNVQSGDLNLGAGIGTLPAFREDGGGVIKARNLGWILQLGGDSATSTELRFAELSGNGSNYYSFKVPDSIGSNVELTWNVTAATCTGDGNAGALTVNGSNEIVCSADDGGAGSAASTTLDVIEDTNASSTTEIKSFGWTVDSDTASSTFRITGHDGWVTIAERIVPDTDDGASLGEPVDFNWRDLYLATEATINFNNGDAVLTGSSAGIVLSGTGNSFSAGGNISSTGGTVSAAVGFDCIGDVDCDYGSADIDDHTFITDGTGDGEIVLPTGSIGTGEILDDTISFGDIDYSITLAGNPALGANESYFGANGLIFESTAADTNELLLNAAALSGDITVTLPNITGTLMSLAGTQTVTGTKTFPDSVLFGNALTHTGDTDTQILYTADQIVLTAGGVTAITIAESTTDTLTFGNYLPVFTNAPRPASNDGAALGVSGTAWSDLFLASGSVINLNAGDVLLTHSANTLTLSGGVLAVPDVGITINSLAFAAADAGANAIYGWDDTAGQYENLSQAEVLTVIGGASTSAQGVVEIATAAETTTGTDATRAVSPDGFAGSDYGKRVVTMEVFGPTTAVTNGDGKKYFRMPSVVEGYNIIAVAAQAVSASSSGADMEVQIHNASSSADLLSTKLFIDVNETDSSTAATSSVINTSNDHVSEAEQWRVDVDAGDGIFDGLVVEMQLQKP